MKLRQRHPNAFLVGPAAIFIFGALLATGVLAGPAPAGLSAVATALPTATAGSQGLDTSLPLTDSAVTVQGRAPFDTLKVTVNQTAKLTNQAVSITWSGGAPTAGGHGTFTANFLQIMQCWGDDDGTHPENPGPPPEQCEQGAAYADPNGPPAALFGDGVALSRIISRVSWPNYDPTVGFNTPGDENVWRPFKAVDGKVVNVQLDPTFDPATASNYWANPYFNAITTNEVPGAVTTADGKGAELFQVLTSNEASGLGCGKKVEPVSDGSFKVPKCWIVVVPRGDQAMENVGTPSISFGGSVPVATSPLSTAAWAHRIAIPLDFTPLDSPCTFADVERRLAGSALAIQAVSSWQPVLCGAGGLPPFDFAPVADATARALISAGTPGGPGLAVVSRPLPPDNVPPDKPIVYAPLTVSGLVIGFNIERQPKVGETTEYPFGGQRVADLNLTPRLVAKLLTQSYGSAASIQGAQPYAWMKTNPGDMSRDPDFVKFNPEFNLLTTSTSKTFSGLQLPTGNSDAARQMWEWVFADPEAKAFLDGQPDPWGMTVNPVYLTNAAANPAGIAFGDPLPETFPKADPFCYQAPAQGPGGSVVPPLLCGTDWMPYTRDFVTAAQAVRAANDLSRVIPNLLAENPSQVWKLSGPQLIGSRAMLAVTDTPSAVRYGLQVAKLSRAGDDADDRAFIQPDSAGLAAGVASMRAKDVPSFLEPDSSVVDPGAYPLTAITYAAVSPLSLDTSARSDFAKFLEYGAGAGQVSGLDLGQLPQGYAPLPPALAAQAAAAVQQIRTMQPAPTTTEAPSAPETTVAARPVRRPTVAAPPPDDVVSTTEVATTAASTTVAAPESTVAATTSTVEPVLTPSVAVQGSRFAVPGLGLMAMASALGALEITKRPRRRSLLDPPDELEDALTEGTS